MWDMLKPVWSSRQDAVMNEYFNNGKKCVSESMRKIIATHPMSTTMLCLAKNDADAYKEMLVACKDKYTMTDRAISGMLDVLILRAAPARFFRCVFDVFNKELSSMTSSELDNRVWFTSDSAFLIRRRYLIDDNEKTIEQELELIDRLDQSPLVKAIVKGFLFPN